MSPTRRQILAGGLAVGVGAALPAQALPLDPTTPQPNKFKVSRAAMTPAAPLPASPILGVQQGPVLHTMRVRYQPDTNGTEPNPAAIAAAYASKKPLVLEGQPAPGRISIMILKEVPQTPVRDLADAEDQFVQEALRVASQSTFDLSRVTYVPENPDAPVPDERYLPFAAFTVLLQQASHRIVARTRRNSGNTVLMHPQTFLTAMMEPMLPLLRLDMADFTLGKVAYKDTNPHNGVDYGRWHHQGRLVTSGEGGLDFFTGPMPENVALVLYKGMSAIDAPAFYSQSPDGNHLTFLRRNPTGLGDFSDYVHAVRLKL